MPGEAELKPPLGGALNWDEMEEWTKVPNVGAPKVAPVPDPKVWPPIYNITMINNINSIMILFSLVGLTEPSKVSQKTIIFTAALAFLHHPPMIIQGNSTLSHKIVSIIDTTYS